MSGPQLGVNQVYHMDVTITEDLIGVTITAQAQIFSGRKATLLSTETWLVAVPGGVDNERHAEIRRILDSAVSELSQKLRRVFPGESAST